MIDFGPPINIGTGPGGVIKIKRGGGTRAGNSGGGQRRIRQPVFARRDFHKPSKHGDYRHLPKPPDTPVIWNPTDPFIIQFQHSHQRPQAAWRTNPGYARVKRVSKRLLKRRAAAKRAKEDARIVA